MSRVCPWLYRLFRFGNRQHPSSLMMKYLTQWSKCLCVKVDVCVCVAILDAPKCRLVDNRVQCVASCFSDDEFQRLFFFFISCFCFCKRQLVGNVLLYILHVCENGKKKKFPRVTVLMLLSFGMNVPSRWNMLTENKKIVVESSNLLGGVAVFVTSRKKKHIDG